MNRRNLLKLASSAALVSGGVALLPGNAAAVQAASPSAAPADLPLREAKRLSFINTHTGDTFADAYWEGGAYVPDALSAINQVMRDHRTGEVHDIDPRLLDQLHTLRGLVDASAPYQIISGYRSPATNAALHANSSGVASRSLHMDGRAIDIRVRGVDLTRLRDAALGMHAGGVGYYAASNFIHIDTGRVRRW
ncbi:MAG: YcbK family protein [Hyphomonadaceae bacterium]|nr:YcbK family protein [Hyphomonadaceae bacterium]GIK48697.1 MAG: twin-arginine translocation pathway signal [Alphaproteobacteria bacterium]